MLFFDVIYQQITSNHKIIFYIAMDPEKRGLDFSPFCLLGFLCKLSVDCFRVTLLLRYNPRKIYSGCEFLDSFSRCFEHSYTPDPCIHM